MRLLNTIIHVFMLATVLTMTAAAQKRTYKVEEASARKVPAWVNSAGKDYLCVTAAAADIEAAKAAVLEDIKKQIAQSIATRIVSESLLTTSTVQTGSNMDKTSTLESSILSRTARLPYIGEISLSKVSDYYWERRRDRSTGLITYFYAVKYPFTEFEMKKLVLEYQAHDKSLDERLSGYEGETDFITSIEQIGETIGELRLLQAEFDSLDPRYDRVQNLIAKYRSLYDRITVNIVQEKKGMAVACLYLDGRSISTGQRPVFQSECLTDITYSYEGNSLVIGYNDEYCYEDDDNTLTVRFRAGNKYISGTIRISL